MATKADFNAEEWSKLVEAPLLAGLRVSKASGGGKIREAVAVARGLRRGAEGAGRQHAARRDHRVAARCRGNGARR